jgi:hypothetical protein
LLLALLLALLLLHTGALGVPLGLCSPLDLDQVDLKAME